MYWLVNSNAIGMLLSISLGMYMPNDLGYGVIHWQRDWAMLMRGQAIGMPKHYMALLSLHTMCHVLACTP